MKEKKSNVVLITIDCLRADHLSFYGYHRKTTPFIDKLANEGLIFENAYANGPFTAASFISILASKYPLEIKEMLPLPKNTTLISQILKENKIRTAAIHSNPYLSSFYGYCKGWDYFMDFLSKKPKKEKKSNPIKYLAKKFVPQKIKDIHYCYKLSFGMKDPYENAEVVTNYAIAWLKKNSKHPFFLWIHYMDIHEPYIKTKSNYSYYFSKNLSKISIAKTLYDLKGKRITQRDINNVINMYDDKIRFIDENIRQLFRFLKDSCLMDKILTIITADHGQQFLEHGCIGHPADFYDQLLHIPLIITGMKGGRKSTMVQQLDIVPTILSIYGISPPPSCQGHNLFSSVNIDHVISETAHNDKGIYISNNIISPACFKSYSIRTKEWKYISRKDREELYNLKKDPKENNNLHAKESEVVKTFKLILEEHIRKEKISIEKGLINKKINALKKLVKI